MRFICFLLAAFTLASCHITKPGLRSEGSFQNSGQDTIVFVSMKMWKDSVTRKSNIDLINLFKKAAKLKKQSYDNKNGNYLECNLFSTKNTSKDSFTIEHPLYRQIEFPQESNRMGKKEIILKESEFFIRFDKDNFNSLLIKDYSPESSGKELITIKF